jgi:hypothetical protein
MGARTRQGASSLDSLHKFFFHPEGERKICKGVKWACPLAGFGAEPQGFDPADLGFKYSWCFKCMMLYCVRIVMDKHVKLSDIENCLRTRANGKEGAE